MSDSARSRVLPVAVCVVFAVAACLIAPAQTHATPPGTGSIYREGPLPPQDKRAASAANEALKREQSPTRVSTSDVQAGVIVGSNAKAKKATVPKRKHGQSSASTKAPAPLTVSAAATELVVGRAGGAAEGAPSVVWPISLALALALIAALLSIREPRRAAAILRRRRAP